MLAIGIVCVVGGLQAGLVAGAWLTWKYLRLRAAENTSVELLRPLLGALIAQNTGEIGPSMAAIQHLTRRAADEAAAISNREETARAHVSDVPAEGPGSDMANRLARGRGLGLRMGAIPFGPGPLGRPSYDETETGNSKKPEAGGSGA